VYEGDDHHKVEKIKVSGFKKSKQHASSSSKKSEKVQKRSGKFSNRKHKHEFLKKVLTSCLEYVFIFAKWLWMLVYDVGYLSFGIVWDRLDWYFQSVKQGIEYARRELKANPIKSLFGWFRNWWKKFDAKFDKKSKWAIWRWKQNCNNEKSTFKDGKLPKTAEEAMKSLLNCKEKDAYRFVI
jgi:DnaJ homolog subfamily C member 14